MLLLPLCKGRELAVAKAHQGTAAWWPCMDLVQLPKPKPHWGGQSQSLGTRQALAETEKRMGTKCWEGSNAPAGPGDHGAHPSPTCNAELLPAETI